MRLRERERGRREKGRSSLCSESDQGSSKRVRLPGLQENNAFLCLYQKKKKRRRRKDEEKKTKTLF